jgi:hypothetical protein
VNLRTVLSLVLLAAVQSAAADEPKSPVPRVTEELASLQPARIDLEIERISQHSPPGAQVYFVGFAGFGEERVFAEEIALASTRVAERYGSRDRTLRLVNDRRDVDSFPLATAAALRYALKGLGRVMDSDDVLFLALSSHGRKGAHLSVTNTGMRESTLDAKDLAQMLRESGIRWRVIVVSACFSGSFVKPLADDHTIVITAASKNRTSFGCSDQRDLTYFGEAFYRDAFPGSTDLRAAFEAARREIHQRELAEDFMPSKPQAFFGPVDGREVARHRGYGSSVAPMSQRSHSRAAPRPSLMAHTTSD